MQSRMFVADRSARVSSGFRVGWYKGDCLKEAGHELAHRPSRCQTGRNRIGQDGTEAKARPAP